MCDISAGYERLARISLVHATGKFLHRTESKLVRRCFSILENIFLIQEENTGRKSKRDNRLRVQVPNMQVFYEHEHQSGVEADVGELHAERVSGA